MEKERKYQHAFVKYTRAGKIVSGSLIIARNYPKDNGIWLEVTESICCEPDCECTGNGIKRAYIRFSQGHVVPGSLLISDMCPPDIGCWKEIPVDICCKEKNCTTSTTTTTTQPITSTTTSSTTSTSTTTSSSTSTTSSSTTSSTTSTSSTSSTTTSSTSTTSTTTEAPTTTTTSSSTTTSTSSTTTSSSTTSSTSTTSSSSTTTTTTDSLNSLNIFDLEVEASAGKLFFDLLTTTSDPATQLYIDWGDGNDETTPAGATIIPTHTYSTIGTYIIRVKVLNITAIDPLTFDVYSEFSGTSVKLLSISSFINESPTNLYITGKGNMVVDPSASINLNLLSISGISAINYLNVTNTVDLSTSVDSSGFTFQLTYCTPASLVLPLSLSSYAMSIILYGVTNTTLNDILVIADTSGLLDQNFDSTLSGSASGLGLTAVSNLGFKGWNVTITP